MKIRSLLYRTANVLGDVSVVANPKPSRIATRVKNKVVGRMLSKLNIWR